MKIYLLLFLSLISFLNKSFAQQTQDYIITQEGDTILGKVTYQPGDKILFRAATQKKTAEYKPLSITGYYSKGTLKLSKYDNTHHRAVFSYHYRMNEDSAAFQKNTGIVVLQKGKITLYYKLPSVGYKSVVPGYVTYELAGTDEIYSSNIYSVSLQIWDKETAIQTLAKLLKENSELYERVINMKEKFDIKYVSEIVREYNDWYANHTKS